MRTMMDYKMEKWIYESSRPPSHIINIHVQTLPLTNPAPAAAGGCKCVGCLNEQRRNIAISYHGIL